MNLFCVFKNQSSLLSLLPPSVLRHYDELRTWLQQGVFFLLKKRYLNLKESSTKNISWKRSRFRWISWSVSGPPPWRPRPSLQRLLLGGLAIHLSWQPNHIIFLPIDDHCHQTSSCPITSLNSTHSLSSCRSEPTPPSILPSLIQSLGDPPPSSSATASINHSHLLSVQLLDLLMGGKPGLKWCTADFYTFPDCFQWEGKAIIPWPCPASIQHERLNAHHFHPRR